MLEESWIKPEGSGYRENGSSEEGERHFNRAIKPCMDAWFRCFDRFRETGKVNGVVSEVRSTLDWLRGETALIQKQLLTEPAFTAQRELLLTLDPV